MTEARLDTQAADDAPGDVRSDRPARRTWWTRWGRLATALLVGLLAAAATYKLRTVPVPTDPWHYVEAGLTFPQMSWNLTGLTRYGMILPMVVVTRLFHLSELSFYLTPCLASGVLLGAVYWLTARFFGPIAAVAASVLTLANSVVLVNASRMYPDVYAVAMVAVAVATAVAVRDRWQRDGGSVTAPLVGLLVVTGVFVGLSWWMRETSIFAWPVIAAVLLWRGGPPRRVVVPAAGVPPLVMLGIEMVISKLAFGNALARFQALLGGDLSSTTNPADMTYLGQSRLAYLTTMPRAALTLPDAYWMLAIAAIALVAGVLFPRKVGLFAGWFLLVALLFTAAGGALRPHQPNIRLDVVRYWIAYIPPMVIAAVGGVATLVRLLADRWGRALPRPARAGLAAALAVALAAGPVVASAHGVESNATFIVTNGNVTAQFRNWLHTHDRQVKRVFTDYESERILPVYTRSFTGHRMAKVRWYSLTAAHHHPRTGDYVVLFSAYGETCAFCHDVVTTVWLSKNQDKLRTWQKVWQTSDRSFVVYRVP